VRHWTILRQMTKLFTSKTTYLYLLKFIIENQLVFQLTKMLKILTILIWSQNLHKFLSVYTHQCCKLTTNSSSRPYHPWKKTQLPKIFSVSQNTHHWITRIQLYLILILLKILLLLKILILLLIKTLLFFIKKN
jgi:hypothetical protein